MRRYLPVLAATFLLAGLSAGVCLAAAPGLNVVLSASADLDGDGEAEEISISAGPYGDYTLTAGRASARGEMEDAVDGFAVIDIDANDRYKEVAVHTPGPSDDDVYLVYWYDGNALRELAQLSRWPVFTGYGIVYVDGWMGFWTIREKYVLQQNPRALLRVPQAFYYVGVEAEVDQGFPLLEARDDGAGTVANLRGGSTIAILVCDISPEEYGDDWYLVKSETNLVGWVRERVLTENVQGLGWAD